MERKTPLISAEDLRRQAEISDYIKSFWEGQGKTPLAYVETYGCQQNEADSEQLRGMLERCGYGLTDGPEDADVIVINTCAIGSLTATRLRKCEKALCRLIFLSIFTFCCCSTPGTML